MIAGVVSGAEVVPVPAEGPVKPPMLPSDIEGLRDFTWTDVRTVLSERAADLSTQLEVAPDTASTP